MAHVDTYPCMNIIISVNRKLSNRFFSVNVTILIANVSSFLPILMLKLFHFYKLKFCQVDIIKFSIMLSSASQYYSKFHLFFNKKSTCAEIETNLDFISYIGMMIAFWGLMKTTNNTYGAVNYSKESMLLRSLLMY